MKQRVIEIGKVAAVSAFTVGLVLCSNLAQAEESVQHVAIVGSPMARAAAAPVLTIGGLKPGQVMVIGAGTSEVMSAAAFAQRPVMTPAMKAAQACILK